MKKRLFRNLLMLGLLLITLTAAVSAATFKGLFYKEAGTSSNIDWDKAPAEQINMTATFYCNKCSSNTTVIEPASPKITLTGIQFPAGSNYHSMTLTVAIEQFKCTTCNTTIGPIRDLNVTFNSGNNYFCHSGYSQLPLTASSSASIESGRIEFAIETAPHFNLKQCSPRAATCAQVGIKDNVNCKHCDGCGKYFDPDGTTEISADTVEIKKTAHTYNLTTGKCTACGAQAPAHLGNQFYATFAEALTAYNTSGGTLTAYSLPENTTIDLTKSGKLVINNGAAASKITMSDGLTVTIENAGTISSIEMNQSGTVTIQNSGTINEVKMDKPGTLTIDNRKQIDLIQTPVNITGDGTRTINVTNSGTITTIDAMNTWITVQNDGRIGELRGFFSPYDAVLDDMSRKNMVTLQRGAGIYETIASFKPAPKYTPNYDTALTDFSKLQGDDDYFYLPGKSPYWWRYETASIYTHAIVGVRTLQNAYFTGLPFSSIEVTGEAGDFAPVKLTPDENGRLTMTVKAGQTVTLTGGVTLPDQGLKSDKEKLAYSWTCNAPGGSGSGNVFTFEDILYGEYDLTLTVTDNQYHHLKKVNIHIKAEKPAGEKIELFFRIPSSGDVFTKIYDGTTAKPKPPHQVEIEFYVKNNSDVERTILVPSDCYEPTINYASPNCSNDNPITVKVELTAKGKENYTLVNKTVTVPGKITQTAPSYKISQTEGAHVGDSVFPRLTFAGFWYGPKSELLSLFDPVTPGTPIMVEDEPLSVTFYRLHPENIKSEWQGQITDFIHDPSMNEELTTDSTFTAVGKYYVYAVVQPTQNFEGVEKTGCLVINVQNTEASSEHHTDYTGWDGTFTASEPIAANKTKSVYLSSSLPTIYTELLLGQGKNLTLCLNGKTLSATNGVTSYNHIRVTDSAALAIDDCVGTGTVKGAAANGGWGGIAYVKNGTLTIKHGKFTGGTASTGGGAIVVEAGGTLIIDGGEISGNTVTDGNGGAIYIKSGGTVNIYGGTIKNNHVYSGNGGAIYVEAGGTLNLYGGTITGNTASGLGGGIYVEEGGTLKIQGNPVVTGNTAGGKDSNVYVCVDSTNPLLTISGELTDGAKLGVSTNAPYPILLAASEQDYSTYFTPDDPDAFVLFSSSALTLCAKPSATFNGTELTVTTGDKYASDACILFVAEYGKDGRMLAVQSKTVEPGTADYTFTVKNSGAKLKCFLLRKDTYTPLFEAFTPQ